MFYGWIIVGIAFVTLMMTMGTWFSFSVFYVEILKEFGWSRAATASVFSVYAVTHGIMSPVVGLATQRWGSRTVITAGSFIMGVGLILSSRTSEVWHLFVYYGCIVAIGGSFIGYPPNTAVVSNWFRRRRGLALGTALAGSGSGMLIFGPLSQQLIDAFDWRTAYLFLALIVLFLVLPLNLIFSRYHPSEKGLTIDGDPEESRSQITQHASDLSSVQQWTLGTAFRSHKLWLVFITHSSMSVLLQIVMIHQFAYLTDLGLARTFAASLIGVVGFFNIFGQIFGGMLCDRASCEVSFSVNGSLVVLSLVAFMMLRPGGNESLYYVYPILFGFGIGGASMVSVVAASNIFQGPVFATVQGALSFGWGFGGGLGVLLAGWVFDITSSYQIAFTIAMLFCPVAATSIWLAAPRSLRRSIRSAA